MLLIFLFLGHMFYPSGKGGKHFTYEMALFLLKPSPLAKKEYCVTSSYYSLINLDQSTKC